MVTPPDSLSFGQVSHEARVGIAASPAGTLPAMSSFTLAEARPSPLDRVIRQAGAVLANRDGRSVAIHYGSAAAELAVCVSAVGLVDRSELTKLLVEAPSAQLGSLIKRLLGDDVAPGGALQTGGAWWCRASPSQLVVVGEPAAGPRLAERVRAQARHHARLAVTDLSEDWAAIGVAGRATPQVLATLGVYGAAGDPRAAAPFAKSLLSGTEVKWLLQSDRSALALAPRHDAEAVWRAIDDAGRPCGISCVGHEAATRYRLVERGRLPG
jgi:glycine cleavage system aminomethyltransferase T